MLICLILLMTLDPFFLWWDSPEDSKNVASWAGEPSYDIHAGLMSTDLATSCVVALLLGVVGWWVCWWLGLLGTDRRRNLTPGTLG